MRIKFIYIILCASITQLLFTGCEKVIDLKLNNAAPQLVIEGNVTNQSAVHTVKISQSVPFTDSNKFPAVSGAVVTINDDRGNFYNLTETSPGIYSTPRFTGRTNYKYTLTVTVNGQTYTASSVMPPFVRFDNLTYKDSFFDSNKKIMTIHYQDPPNSANQYHYIIYIDGVQIKNNVLVNNDNFTNGRYVDEDLFQRDNDILVGNVVTVEAQCIDNNVFTYLFSLSEQLSGGPKPTPSNPPSNLSNNALGYFSAHTTQKLSTLIR
ncbi:MAG: DUF4249 domain-containing protein [Sphingobacteriaceae bacterium]|nr:MAG: DUF4249 domain-containing protein [Sphingobacteriaceae bacterium]